MRIHSVCYYRSKSESWTDEWENSHYTARNIVKGVKRLPFKGHSMMKLKSGKQIRLDSSPNGQAVALGFASQMLEKLITNAGYENANVIPIPSSSHINPCAEFTGSRLAHAIQKKNQNLIARPLLYFDQILAKSAGGGGGRNPYDIQRHLRPTTDLSGLQNVVLLDDVFTSGAHVRAAARFLAEQGVTVNDSFVVGRTIWEKPENMFSCPTEIIGV